MSTILMKIIYMNIWDSVVLFLVAVAVISFTHFWYKWTHPKCNGGKLPPGSMGFPLFGESLQFFIPTRSLDMPRFVQERIAKYGKVFRTSLAGRPIVVSADPEFSYYILQQEGKLVNLWYMDSFSSILGEVTDAIATLHIHKYVRNIVLNHFGTETLKESLMSTMEVTTKEKLQTWSTQPSVELKQSLTSMIFDITSKRLFNYDASESSSNLSQMFTHDILQGLMSFPINIPGTAYNKCLKNQARALNLMRGILHERMKSPEKRCGDFLDQIVEDMKKEEFLKEDFVLFFMFGLLFASFETISATLSVGMTLLSEHPEVVKQLTEEHETLLRNRENPDSQLTWQEFKSLTFTPMVVNEILRMSSVAPGILRKVIKDIHTNGYVIPEGWTIMVVPSALQMNPEKYKDPLAFNPWRWKDLGANVAKNFIPFGGGSRNCAGADFSKVLISVFLHVLVTNYSWKKLKGGKLGRTPALSFGNDGLHIKISKRGEINTTS